MLRRRLLGPNMRGVDFLVVNYGMNVISNTLVQFSVPILVPSTTVSGRIFLRPFFKIVQGT